jgi:tryptophan synthase alpha chain
MTTALDDLFVKTRAENRAALIAYIPAGFPSIEGCKKVIQAFVDGGVDAIEIGFPYSDPVMDGPTIQAAADQALAQSIADNGGSGVITPDLTIEESASWKAAVEKIGINPIYVVAPSTTDARLPQVTSRCGGFIYAASLMGVTGTRTSVSSGAPDLVARIRTTSQLPIAVGLGVSTREQAKGVAGYADGVIVGSAFIKALLDAPDEASGLAAVKTLASELALGVREGR